MKKTILLIVGLLLVVSLSYAKEKDVTVSWQQTLPAPNDLAGWWIGSGEQSGVYDQWEFVPYKTTQTTYTYSFARTKMKKKQNFYYVLYSVDTSGNASAYTTPVLINLDPGGSTDTTAPAIPTNVTVVAK